MATTVVQDIQAILDPLVAGGSWYGANTREPPAFPFIVWSRIVSTPNVTLAGQSDQQNTRIQIDIFSLSVQESLAIELSVEAAFSATSTVNVPISSGDSYEDAIRAYRCTKEYSVWSTN